MASLWVETLHKAIMRENRSSDTTCVRDRERQDRTGQSKNHNPPSWGEAPTHLICTRICRVVAVPDIMTRATLAMEFF